MAFLPNLGALLGGITQEASKVRQERENETQYRLKLASDMYTHIMENPLTTPDAKAEAETAYRDLVFQNIFPDNYKSKPGPLAKMVEQFVGRQVPTMPPQMQGMGGGAGVGRGNATNTVGAVQPTATNGGGAPPPPPQAMAGGPPAPPPQVAAEGAPPAPPPEMGMGPWQFGAEAALEGGMQQPTQQAGPAERVGSFMTPYGVAKQGVAAETLRSQAAFEETRRQRNQTFKDFWSHPLIREEMRDGIINLPEQFRMIASGFGLDFQIPPNSQVINTPTTNEKGESVTRIHLLDPRSKKLTLLHELPASPSEEEQQIRETAEGYIADRASKYFNKEVPAVVKDIRRQREEDKRLNAESDRRWRLAQEKNAADKSQDPQTVWLKQLAMNGLQKAQEQVRIMTQEWEKNKGQRYDITAGRMVTDPRPDAKTLLPELIPQYTMLPNQLVYELLSGTYGAKLQADPQGLGEFLPEEEGELSEEEIAAMADQPAVEGDAPETRSTTGMVRTPRSNKQDWEALINKLLGGANRTHTTPKK